MRKWWMLVLVLSVGCKTSRPAAQTTQAVPAAPFVDPRAPIVQTRATYAPATQDTRERVELVRARLVGGKEQPAPRPYLVELVVGKSIIDNPQSGLRPIVTAIGSADPEVFHTGADQIFITEGLVRQCQSDAQLAAVLANEMGRMISEREAATSQETRRPAPPPPINLPIGGAGMRDGDPLAAVELGRYERAYPKQPANLSPPNPQQIARTILENAGFQRTDLDAATPILQNAQRNHTYESQFKGGVKSSDWKTP